VEAHLPIVSLIEINNGAIQRSRVTSVRITFSDRVSLPATATDAFEVKRKSDNALPTLVASVDNSGAGTVVTLTFTGTTAVDNNSLADGRYTLTIFASTITGAAGLLDGNQNGIAEGSPTDNKSAELHRLFGDADGNGSVTSTDFAVFRTFFGLGSSMFDFDNDGQTNSNDFAEFRKRFGITLMP